MLTLQNKVTLESWKSHMKQKIVQTPFSRLNFVGIFCFFQINLEKDLNAGAL